MSDKKDEKRVIKPFDELLAYFDELEFFIDHFFEGVRLAKQDQLLEAEMMFRKTLEGHEDGGTWFNLARTLDFQSREAYAKAESHFRRSLEEIREEYDGEIPDEYFTEYVPHDMELLQFLATSQFRQFKIEDAEATLRWILRIKPDDQHAWDLLGRCLQITCRIEEASLAYMRADALKEAAENTPDSESTEANSRVE